MSGLMRLWLMVALILGAMTAPAAADTEPLPAGTVVAPRDGQGWTASSWPGATPSEMHDFAVYAADYDDLPDAFAFAVATSPETSADDGLLAHPISSYPAPAQPDRLGIYTARTSVGDRWLGTPGTYYWQASYIDVDEGDTYAGPVRTLTIIARPPPEAPPPPVAPALPPPPPSVIAATPRPPDVGTVRTVVRRAIHSVTHMVPRNLVYRCTRMPAAATCRPSWRDFRARYRGTLHVRFETGAITATFSGKRTPFGHRRARAVTWTTVL
jgi:hypothetical protein